MFEFFPGRMRAGSQPRFERNGFNGFWGGGEGGEGTKDGRMPDIGQETDQETAAQTSSVFYTSVLKHFNVSKADYSNAL